jgi:hypothetical protein
MTSAGKFSLLGLEYPAQDFIILFSAPQYKSMLFKQAPTPHFLALFVLYGPIIFPFLTDYEKIYLMQLFVNVDIMLS